MIVLPVFASLIVRTASTRPVVENTVVKDVSVTFVIEKFCGSVSGAALPI